MMGVGVSRGAGVLQPDIYTHERYPIALHIFIPTDSKTNGIITGMVDLSLTEIQKPPWTVKPSAVNPHISRSWRENPN